MGLSREKRNLPPPIYARVSLVSFPGRLVELSLGRVYVHQGGSGPPLLLIHGLFVSHYCYGPVLEELERRFAVTAFDLPGFGESDHPDLEHYRYDPVNTAAATAELMGVLGISQANVIGHSMGGGVAMTLAARHPERVHRLVLEDGWAYHIDPGATGRLSLLPFIGPILFERVLGRRDFAHHFHRVPRDPGFITEEYIDYYWERFNRSGARRSAHAALKAYDALSDDNVDPGRVSAPTLVIWGADDRLIPLDHGRRLARQIPGARLSILPLCGHSPHEEKPSEFLAEVIPFLEGREKPESAAS